MKNITPKDTRYIPFTQQRQSCMPTSISIVMYKLGIPLVPQELLGYYLGLKLSKEDKNLFWNPRISKRRFGTSPDIKKYSPSVAFKKLKIPLKIKLHLINEFKTKEELIFFLSNCVKEDKHILVRFNNGVLNNNDKNNTGHVCVVDRIYKTKNMIRLIDPSPKQPKWREVDIDKLKKAIELHPSKRGGFWELEKTKVRK